MVRRRRRRPSCYDGYIQPDGHHPHLFLVDDYKAGHAIIAVVRKWLRDNIKVNYTTQKPTFGGSLRIVLDNDNDAVLFKMCFSDVISFEKHVPRYGQLRPVRHG